MTPVDGDTHPIVDKTLLRRALRERRARHVASLSPSIRALAFRVLPSPVLRRLAPGATISLYYATGDEAPTAGIATQLEDLGYRLALPRATNEAGVMTFAHWDPDRVLVPGLFRTLQPDAEAAIVVPDVIIAPLMGFDGKLNRLGQGGGYFDRAFATHPDAIRIGLGWSAQQVEAIPTDSHDMQLHLVVTESAILERGTTHDEI